MKTSLIFAIRAYQALVSPLLPPACRFWPTCSNYAVEAVEQHGVLAGAWLALRRLFRCHPFHPGGIDPVPDVNTRADAPAKTSSRHAVAASPRR